MQRRKEKLKNIYADAKRHAVESNIVPGDQVLFRQKLGQQAHDTIRTRTVQGNREERKQSGN